MIYLKNFVVCLLAVLCLVLGTTYGESTNSELIRDNEGFKELTHKIDRYLDETGEDFESDDFSDDFKMALLKRALPRMGKRNYWDDYDLSNSEEFDYVDKRALPRMGRALPRMGRALPRMGRALPRMGRALPRMGRTLPRMG